MSYPYWIGHYCQNRYSVDTRFMHVRQCNDLRSKSKLRVLFSMRQGCHCNVYGRWRLFRWLVGKVIKAFRHWSLSYIKCFFFFCKRIKLIVNPAACELRCVFRFMNVRNTKQASNLWNLRGKCDERFDGWKTTVFNEGRTKSRHVA